ncbi:glycoside hydrolase family 73 protein [Dellaglioa sp. BT-FLS60]
MKKKNGRGIFIKNGKVQVANIVVLILILGIITVVISMHVHKNNVVRDESIATSLSTSKIEASESAKKAAEAAKKQAFIKKVSPEAQKMQKKYHVFSSITIAQAILESDWGTSSLAKDYNNLFGIKGTGKRAKDFRTKEQGKDGKWEEVTAKFIVFKDWDEAIMSHSKLLAHGNTWDKNQFSDVISATTYEDAAAALIVDGYATDNDYSTKLTDIIKQYKLDQYDK